MALFVVKCDLVNPALSFKSNNSIQYNTIQYKHEYYYSGINLVEFRGHNSIKV